MELDLNNRDVGAFLHVAANAVNDEAESWEGQRRGKAGRELGRSKRRMDKHERDERRGRRRRGDRRVNVHPTTKSYLGQLA